MALTRQASSRSELLFLRFDVLDLKGPRLPTNGDVLRYYFHRHRKQPAEAPRAIARAAVEKCNKIWRDNGIPTTHDANGIKYLMKMLSKFNAMRQKYTQLSAVHQKHTVDVWNRKFDLIFSIATKDAVKKCSEKSRKMLLAAKEKEKEFRKATNNDKWLVDFKKQERMLEVGQTLLEQVRNTSDGAKKSRSQQVRKQIIHRPGPKCSKKRHNDDASAAPIVSNPGTLNNIEAPTLTRSVDRPGPKCSKKRHIDDTSAAPIVSNSVTPINIEAPKLTQRVDRPGPKSSKKRYNDGASAAPIVSNSIMVNNKPVQFTLVLKLENISIKKEMDCEGQSMDTISPGGLDVAPEDEDIIPPMIQKTIVKEEIQMDWDPADNWSTSVLPREHLSMGDKENDDPLAGLVNFSHTNCKRF